LAAQKAVFSLEKEIPNLKTSLYLQGLNIENLNLVMTFEGSFCVIDKKCSEYKSGLGKELVCILM